MRPEPGERRPTYTREQIVQVALLIADEEGFEAVSMRRVASALGAGTMTLYHYIPTKEALVALMTDAIMGELVVPADELPEGWREGLLEIARRTRDVFARHPWIGGQLEEREDEPAGPNALRHFEQSLAVAARTGADIERQFEIVALVDDFVFGYAIRAQAAQPMASDTEASQRHMEVMLAYVEKQLATGEFPHLQAFAGDDLKAAFQRFAELAESKDRFERGLNFLLDGIELSLNREARRS
jgi:AcrR family transcriptional regulator